MLALGVFAKENSAKDQTATFLAKMIIGHYISEKNIGELIDMNIDTTQRRIQLLCKVKGEDNPLSVTVGHYEFKKEEIIEPCTKKATGNYATFLLMRSLVTNKEWLNALASESLKEFRINVPKNYYGILELLLQ